MMDKYEEFKKWFENQDEIIWHSVKCNTGFIGSEPFNEFEKYLEETEKKEQIKKAIKKGFNTDMDSTVERIYNSLKEGGYLK